MNKLSVVFYCMFMQGIVMAFGQIASDCTNAIPICSNTPINGGTSGFGLDDFNGGQTSGCLERTTSGFIETNSAWYRFRTGASGQLGFNIGSDINEDWDFALYRSSDCNNLGEPVRCNYFENNGDFAFTGVGEDPTGAMNSDLYDDWLQVEPGEEYYILINNFSNTNSGFSIQFSGNIFVTNPVDALDCSIITNLLGPPIAACDSDTVTLDATTSGAISYEWFLSLDNGVTYTPLPTEVNATLDVAVSALYRVRVGISGAPSIPSEVQVSFAPPVTAFPIADAVMCSGDGSYDLSQKNNEVLNGDTSNEFVVNYFATENDAILGENVLPVNYTPTVTQDVYTRVSSIENPSCFDIEQFEITVLETPNLTFEENVFLCEGVTSTIIGETVPNPAYSYAWSTGETTPNITINQAGSYMLTTVNTVGSESCLATRTVTVVISRSPSIVDVDIEGLQDNNRVTVMTDVEGDFEYQLDDAEPQNSNIFSNVSAGEHTVQIIDLNGCGTVSEDIVVVGYNKFFTPNGDGPNDEWTIYGMSELVNPMVSIYDRYGKLLHQLYGNVTSWDGTFNGKPMPSTDYWFKLSYTDNTGQQREAKYINSHFALRR